MKNLLSKSQVIILIILLLSNLGFSQHFTNIWTGNPFQPMNIIIQEATISEIDMEVGDEIAVFDIGEDGSSICVGCLILTEAIIPGSPAVIITGADDDLTDGLNSGYIPTNEVVFKLWDISESLEITWVTPTYNASFASVYTPLETAVATLTTCFESDFDCDCDVDIIDVTMAAYHYGTVEGDANYDARYDLDGDGDIDIIDITMVAYNYGWTCGDKANYAINFNNTYNENVVLSLIPNEETSFSDGSFSISLYAENIQQLGGFDMELNYNPENIEILSIEQGELMGSTQRTVFPIENTIYPIKGEIHYSATSLGHIINGASGQGSLINIIYKPLQASFNIPSFTSAQIARVDGKKIDYIFKDNTLDINETDLENINKSTIVKTFPNPFKDEINIEYKIAKQGEIVLKMHSINGELLKSTNSINMEKGAYNETFSRDGLSAGVYIVSLVVDEEIVDSARVVVDGE